MKPNQGHLELMVVIEVLERATNVVKKDIFQETVQIHKVKIVVAEVKAEVVGEALMINLTTLDMTSLWKILQLEQMSLKAGEQPQEEHKIGMLLKLQLLNLEVPGVPLQRKNLRHNQLQSILGLALEQI